MKKVVAVITILGLLAISGLTVGLVIANQAGSDPDREPRPAPESSAAATEAPATDLERFYTQGIQWEPCEDNDRHDCARVEVPVDYAEPDGETFELNLLRVPAPDTPIGSLVVNPGGPGAPGTSYAAYGGLVFGQALMNNYDIVGFDPRGTGDSSPVDCLSDEDLDDYIAMDPAPDDEAEVQAISNMVDKFGQGCVDKSGDIVGHVTTIEAARDMDVLRAVLGEEQLDYLGASYGTKLGATYAELFPDRVGRFVLDSGVDVSIDSRTMSLEQAGGFERALTAYVEDCIGEGGCPLGDSVEEGLTTIRDLVDDIDATPLKAGQRELRVGNAFYGIVTPLYSEQYWPLLTRALTNAMKGDGAGLLYLSDMYSARQGGTYADNSMEAIYVINCLDDPESVPVDEVPDHVADFQEASPTFGDIFAWGMVGCAGLDARSSEEPLDIRAEGAAPILVLGTTNDPATPMKWSRNLAEQLESGVLIEREGEGHGAYNSGNACVNTIVEDYLIEGTVPDNGTKC